MISKSFVFSDKFISVPSASQLLYFLLIAQGDDDGLLNNAKVIIRGFSLKETDMQPLIENGLIHVFDSGVTVIMNWKENNKIAPTKHTETKYKAEFKQLIYDEDTQYYRLKSNCLPDNSQSSAHCLPNGSKMDTQYSISKCSISKDNVIQGNVVEGKKGKCEGRTRKKEKPQLSDEEMEKSRNSLIKYVTNGNKNNLTQQDKEFIVTLLDKFNYNATEAITYLENRKNIKTG